MPATADITKLGYRFSTDIKTILVIKARSTRTSALMMPCTRSPVGPNRNVVDMRGHLIDGRRRRPPGPPTPPYDLLKPWPRGRARCAVPALREQPDPVAVRVPRSCRRGAPPLSRAGLIGSAGSFLDRGERDTVINYRAVSGESRQRACGRTLSPGWCRAYARCISAMGHLGRLGGA
jgi:hypothetical protein